jgi:hypothetical protein
MSGEYLLKKLSAFGTISASSSQALIALGLPEPHEMRTLQNAGRYNPNYLHRTA